MINLSSHTIDESVLPEVPIVLDVGSRNFGFTKAMLQLRPKAQIYALEPDPAVTDPGIPNVHFFNIALVHDDRTTATYASFSTGEGNYLTFLPWVVVHDANKMEVKCASIQRLMNHVGVSHWDVIKLDCEGAEFQVLENWPSSEICTQITVEFHDYNNLHIHNDQYYQALWAKLSGYHVKKFDLTKPAPQCADNTYGHWDALLSTV